MSDPFIGEIRLVAFSFAPVGWAVCDGALIGISRNTALFSILGTTYGGDGNTTFALPDFRGRGAMQWGSGPGLSARSIGESAGTDTVTLQPSEMPIHTHQMVGAVAPPGGDQRVASPSATASFGASNQGSAYATVATVPAPMSPKAIGLQGGTQPHQNAQPRLALLYCIALEGEFPPRN